MTQVEIVTLTGDTGKDERAIQARLNKRSDEGWTLYAAAGIRDGIALFFYTPEIYVNGATKLEWTIADAQI